MTIRENIKREVITDYYLGVLSAEDKVKFERYLAIYPELWEELEAVKKEIDSDLYVKTPSHINLKEKTWAVIENLLLEDKMDLNHLPLINRFSKAGPWLEALSSLLPETLAKGRFEYMLTHNERLTQVLIMSATDIEEEVHHKTQESFIILHGECECHIGTEKIKLSAGDFLEIPLHESHDVKVLSSYVVAVMQRING
jgi:mannose-6-phosphate isomerase-like protein (cupin superfamily)